MEIVPALAKDHPLIVREGIFEQLGLIKNGLKEIKEERCALDAKESALLETLRDAVTFIEELVESTKTKPAATPISDVEEFDILTRKSLDAADIKFLEELPRKTLLEFRSIPGIGDLALSQVRAAFHWRGLKFAA